MINPTATMAYTAPAGSHVTIDALVQALVTEERLLRELKQVLHDQRQGVAMGDLDRINGSVFAAHRILRTMSEARRRRRTLVGALAGAEDVALSDLEATLGPRCTDELCAARDRLVETARVVSREIALNRRVLQAALRAGDEHLRALLGGAVAAFGYDSSAQPVADVRGHGILIDRQV